jgi:Tfp pilus assembly protein FimV
MRRSGASRWRTLHYDTRAVATDHGRTTRRTPARWRKLQALLDSPRRAGAQIQAALNAGHGDGALLASANQLIADAVALENSTPPMPLGRRAAPLPATLSLTLGPPALVRAFTAGVEHDYMRATTADGCQHGRGRGAER